MLKKKHKIYIAGHKGLVGNAVLSKLKKNNYKNLLLADKKKLNLLDIVKLKNFFKKNKPDVLIICAAKVGGILENKNFQLDFLLENLQIQTNLLTCAKEFKVKRTIFLGSSCIYPKFCKTPIKEEYLMSVRKAGSSCGAVIELRATGIPVGLGAPIYSKLDTDIAAALMSINAVKGVNIGSGMNAAFLSGEENSDEMSKRSGKVKFKTNHAGGILGGISSGQDIVASFAVKPTSSILTSRDTIDKKGKNTKISVKGRHDPCVGIRAVPIGEAMINCVLLDHLLMHRAQCG